MYFFGGLSEPVPVVATNSVAAFEAAAPGLAAMASHMAGLECGIYLLRVIGCVLH